MSCPSFSLFLASWRFSLVLIGAWRTHVVMYVNVLV
jgi:hypothetical protein